MSLAPTLSPSVLQSPTYSSSVDETPAPNNQQISVPPDTAIASSIPGSGIRKSSDLFAGLVVSACVAFVFLPSFSFYILVQRSATKEEKRQPMARKNSVEQGKMDFADVGNSSHCISAVKHNTFAYLDSLFEDMVVVEANQNSVDKRDALHQKTDTPKKDKRKKDKLKMYSSTTDLTHDRLQSRKNDIEVGLESLQPPIRQGNATTATTMDGTSNSTISTPEEMKPKKSKKEKKQRSSYTETTISANSRVKHCMRKNRETGEEKKEEAQEAVTFAI